MKFLTSLIAAAMSLSFTTASPTALQERDITTSWAGVNSYFLHAFKQPDRIAVLDAVKAANLKTIRLFISYTAANAKDTGSVEMPDIEPKQVGTFDDTQLRAVDQLMVEAQARGIKLIIAMHDRYQLGCWGNDTYVTKYKLPAINCANTPARNNDVTWWYQDKNPINDFQTRIRHILEHRNALLPNQPQWKDLSSHIFSFNIQNEGQGHLRDRAPAPEWWCDRANFMRGIMGASKVLISTGGGHDIPNSNLAQNWNCKNLDLVNIHTYAGTSSLEQDVQSILSTAKAANKLTSFEEFGASGGDKANVLKQHIDILNRQKIPWMPWQISKPGRGAGDFEFWTDEASYGVVANGAKAALQIQGAQKWPNL